MEKLLGQLNGQLGDCDFLSDLSVTLADFYLVVYPHRFLEGEDIANNFLFNADRFVSIKRSTNRFIMCNSRLLPLPIYD